MSFGGADTARGEGVAKWTTKLLEVVGILNKGSAGTPAAPSSSDAESTTSVSSNALNVTRVTGLAGVVSSVGAAAIAIFAVDKKTDPANIVMAAYIAVGVIVAAALIAAAIVVLADVRARASISIANIDATKPALAHPSVKYHKAKAGEALTVAATDDVLVIDASEADLHIALPKAVDFRGRGLTFERLDTTDNDVTISDDGAFGPQSLEATSPELKVFAANGAWKVFGRPAGHV